MDSKGQEILDRLDQLSPEERKRTLNSFLEAAIVVNRRGDEGSLLLQETVAAHKASAKAEKSEPDRR